MKLIENNAVFPYLATYLSNIYIDNISEEIVTGGNTKIFVSCQNPQLAQNIVDGLRKEIKKYDLPICLFTLTKEISDIEFVVNKSTKAPQVEHRPSRYGFPVIVPDKNAVCVGIDIGSTSIKSVAMRGEEVLKKEMRLTNCESGSSLCEQIIEMVHNAVQGLNKNKLKGIGLAFAGIVNKGKIICLPNFSRFQGVDYLILNQIKDSLFEQFRVPIGVLHDGEAFTYGEAIKRSILRNTSNSFRVLGLGTEPWTGYFSQGMVFQKVRGATLLRIKVGGHHELRRYVSVKSIIAMANQLGFNKAMRYLCKDVNIDSLGMALKDHKSPGHKIATIVWKYVASYLAQAIQILYDISKFDDLVIAGGVLMAGDGEVGKYLENNIRQCLKRRLFEFPFRIVTSMVDPCYGGAIGGAQYATTHPLLCKK
jgi:predicted NBD/HSP70 family sugar kinase